MTWRISRSPGEGAREETRPDALSSVPLESSARPVDTYEFLSQNTLEVDIAGMDTKAVVHHREMTKALALETVDRQHHVRGVLRMNEVSDDAVCLLPHA